MIWKQRPTFSDLRVPIPTRSRTHSGIRKYLILPDVHSPFHNQILIDSICRLAIDQQFYGLVIAGDFLDMFSLSQYAKNSLGQLREWDLTKEYKAGRMLLKQIADAVGPDCEKHFLYGNHEDRYFRYMLDEDNAKMGEELRDPIEALNLRELRFTVYENWKDDIVHIGPHLEVIHGEACGIHTAKKTLDDNQGSVVFGHSHRYQSHVEGKHGAYNIGFLGDIDSEGFKYMPRTRRSKWVNGFAIAYLYDDGTFNVEAVQCWNNKFIAGGRVY